MARPRSFYYVYGGPIEMQWTIVEAKPLWETQQPHTLLAAGTCCDATRASQTLFAPGA